MDIWNNGWLKDNGYKDHSKIPELILTQLKEYAKNLMKSCKEYKEKPKGKYVLLLKRNKREKITPCVIVDSQPFLMILFRFNKGRATMEKVFSKKEQEFSMLYLTERYNAERAMYEVSRTQYGEVRNEFGFSEPLALQWFHGLGFDSGADWAKTREEKRISDLLIVLSHIAKIDIANPKDIKQIISDGIRAFEATR